MHVSWTYHSSLPAGWCLLFLRIFTEKSFGLLAARTTRGGGKSCHRNINKYATCKVVDIKLAATPIHWWIRKNDWNCVPWGLRPINGLDLRVSFCRNSSELDIFASHTLQKSRYISYLYERKLIFPLSLEKIMLYSSRRVVVEHVWNIWNIFLCPSRGCSCSWGTIHESTAGGTCKCRSTNEELLWPQIPKIYRTWLKSCYQNIQTQTFNYKKSQKLVDLPIFSNRSISLKKMVRLQVLAHPDDPTVGSCCMGPRKKGLRIRCWVLVNIRCGCELYSYFLHLVLQYMFLGFHWSLVLRFF